MTVSDQMFPKQVISEPVAKGKLTDITVMSPVHSQLLKHIKEANKIIIKYHPFHINSCCCRRIATVLVKAANHLDNSCIKYWFILNTCSQSCTVHLHPGNDESFHVSTLTFYTEMYVLLRMLGLCSWFQCRSHLQESLCRAMIRTHK